MDAEAEQMPVAALETAGVDHVALQPISAACW